MSLIPSRDAKHLDFDLNLAPIIDCFTVLIAFLLVSASFVSIGILDGGVAAGGVQASPTENPPVNLVVQLHADHSIEVKLSGRASSTIRISGSGSGASEGFDYDGLSKNLASTKANWASLNGATLLADNSVPYREVVRTLEAVRKTLPAVLLGGF